MKTVPQLGREQLSGHYQRKLEPLFKVVCLPLPRGSFLFTTEGLFSATGTVPIIFQGSELKFNFRSLNNTEKASWQSVSTVRFPTKVFGVLGVGIPNEIPLQKKKHFEAIRFRTKVAFNRI